MLRWLGRSWRAITHAIALLGWLLLAAWIVSHVVELVVEFPDSVRPGNRVSYVATNGAVGYRTTAIWYANEQTIDVRLYYTDFEFDRWMPLRRADDFHAVWVRRVGQGSYRNLLWLLDEPRKTSTVVPILPAIGICFLVSLVREYVPITYWSWLRVSVGVLASGIVLACVATAGIGVFELVRYADGKSTLLLVTANGAILGLDSRVTCDALGTVATFEPPPPNARASTAAISTLFQLRFAADPHGPQPTNASEFLSRIGLGFSRSPTTTVTLPNWLLLLVGVIALRWCVRFLRIERRPGYCRKCSYNLTGNVSGVCPECGTRVPSRRAYGWIGASSQEFARCLGSAMWRVLQFMAVLLVCANVLLLIAMAATHLSGTPDPLGFPSIIADWLIWRVAFLTLLGVAFFVPLRRFEPLGMATYRVIFAVNLLVLLIAAWPKP